jgi:hypothetical protein
MRGREMRSRIFGLSAVAQPTVDQAPPWAATMVDEPVTEKAITPGSARS